ncbi:hypothetical protein COCVIDRAFT_115382, partial [Bipolaris victoriae FI3]
WVLRLLHRYPNDLITVWCAPVEKQLHEAASYSFFRSYFKMLHSTIKQHTIGIENTYNIDKKSFIIRVM